MGDTGDDFRAWKDHKREIKSRLGVSCPRCQELQPKRYPTILLPRQVCRVDGYRDPRKERY